MKTLFAYCDESGNTGNSIKDPKQPILTYSAIVSESDLDVEVLPEVDQICALARIKFLHAKDIPDEHLAASCMLLLPVLLRLNIHFFNCPIDKIDFARLKLFDLFFDSGLNKKVSAFHYGVRGNRLPLAASFIKSVSKERAIEFWDQYLSSDFENMRTTIGNIFDAFREQKDIDGRTRQLISEAMYFYLMNTKIFHESIGNNRFGSPNIAGFSLLLQMIKTHYKEEEFQVSQVKHDIMQQFSDEISELFAIQGKYVHDTSTLALISDISASKLLPPKVDFERGKNSKGIQLVDFITYITQLHRKGKLADLPEYNVFLYAVSQIGWQSGISISALFDEVAAIKKEQFTETLTKDQGEKARAILGMIEDKRKSRT